MKAKFADQRCLFRTQEKRLGLAPIGAKVGDQVWFLSGARVPFVLRKVENERFELVGEAYVHGCMRGEAFTTGGLSPDLAVGMTLI